MKTLLTPRCRHVCARRRARARQGRAAPLQLEQLHRAGNRSSASRICANASVVQTYYSDNEELLAKLAAGAKGYDILVPTSNAVQALIKGGQLKPIDKAQAPNLKNIDADLPQHAVRSGQQVFGALRDVDDDPRLQRREDERARLADRYLGGDLRSEIPDEGQRPCHGARQRERAVRRRAQVSRLLRPTTSTRSTGTRPPR